MGLPPSAGAVQDTVADAFPLVADTPVGASGAVTGAAGVMEEEGADAEPVPTAFLAVTVKVYAVPLVRPPTVVDVAAGDPETVTGVCASCSDIRSHRVPGDLTPAVVRCCPGDCRRLVVRRRGNTGRWAWDRRHRGRRSVAEDDVNKVVAVGETRGRESVTAVGEGAQ